MKHIVTFRLTEQVKHSLERQGYNLTCRRCGNPLQIGEKVVAKRSNWNFKAPIYSRRKYYHEECWESMFFG